MEDGCPAARNRPSQIRQRAADENILVFSKYNSVCGSYLESITMNLNATGRNPPPNLDEGNQVGPVSCGPIKFVYIQNLLYLPLHFEMKVEAPRCTAGVDCASDRASVFAGAGVCSPEPHFPFPPPLRPAEKGFD